MKLDEIQICNFKGLKDARFQPTDFDCLVGENNAGKSSVLQAIVTSLNRPSQISASLFYDDTLPVEFISRFSGVTSEHLQRLAEEHRFKIEELVIHESLTTITRYRLEEKVEVRVLKRIPKEPRYQIEVIDECLKGKKGPAVRQAILENYPEFSLHLPVQLNVTSAKSYLSNQIDAFAINSFEMQERALPSGISSSISALLPETIYIPAVKNLSDDLKTTQSTSFGRLLGLLLEDMSLDLEGVNASLDQLKKLFNRVLADGELVDLRHEKVKCLEGLVESFLSQNFPKVKIELRIPPPELKTILNTAQIFVDDGTHDLIDNKGDGLKRSLTFALLRAYIQKHKTSDTSSQGPAARPLLFLFEEPELYLHPKSQRILFDVLSDISLLYQVVVTTHSPIFFAPGITASFVRVAKKDAYPKPLSILNPVNFKLDQTSAEVFRLAKFDNAEAAFFSERVVLFEGESDDAFCKHVSKFFNPLWDFDKKNIALVRVSGKGNFSKFRKFFNAFGIEIKVVADLDALFEGYNHLGAAPDTDLIRNAALNTIDERIAVLGEIAEPASRQIKDRVNQC